MSNMDATLEVVVNFLQARHYDEQEAIDGVRNGRFIFDWCKASMGKETCPCGQAAALKEMFNLLEHLEDGAHGDGTPVVKGDSNWTRAFTNSALRAGGFEEWPEAEKKRAER